MAEDVFRDALLVREALQQHHHLGLAHGVHALRHHIPALPVYICTATAREKADIRAVSKDIHVFTSLLLYEISLLNFHPPSVGCSE